MSLAFLSLLLQCFISLRCCPKQKSVLLLPGATGDPQPIAKKGTRWASPPLDFTESSAPCTKVSNALCVPLYQGLVTFGHRKQSCLLPSSDSCEDRRSACSLLGIASLRTGEKTDGTHSCVAFFLGCGQAQPAWRAQMQEGSLEEEVLQKMSHFLV